MANRDSCPVVCTSITLKVNYFIFCMNKCDAEPNGVIYPTFLSTADKKLAETSVVCSGCHSFCL
jgi:hypothetical protein